MHMPHRRSGFTLIELLVVIGIICILVSLLFPLASAARRSANMSVCMSNQRQIMTAIKAFANDNNDVCPGSAGGPAPLGGIPASGPGNVPYVTIGQAIACNEALDQATIERTARSSLVVRGYLANGGVFHCPERDASPCVAGVRQPAAIYHYVFNWWFVGDMTCNQTTFLPTYSSPGEAGLVAGLVPVGLNRCKDPSGCVMITEDAVVDGQRWVDYDRITTPPMSNGIQPLDRIHATPVHVYRGNLASDAYPNIQFNNANCTYIDGHCETVPVSTTTLANNPNAFTIPSDSAGIH
jgi:prepilin-type N-terminal cleavage/methylation domain-containing protein